jgi:hypothetical protein
MLRIEINARDEFWGKAVMVEWQAQFPERELQAEADGKCLFIEPDWLPDLQRIAGDCFSEIVVAPKDPSRRRWLSQFIPSVNEHKT